MSDRSNNIPVCSLQAAVLALSCAFFCPAWAQIPGVLQQQLPTQQNVVPQSVPPQPQAVQQSPVQAPPGQRALCVECGTVEIVREAAKKPEGSSGLGAVGGALVGGLLGTQVGRGRGTTAATVVGAAGGAFAGNQIEQNMAGPGSAVRFEVIVRFEDGRQTQFGYTELPRWRSGDRVRLVNGQLQPN